MDNIKVSVIIPVYNTAIYLEQCLDSIIKQTLKEIEIICINDGSTDSSAEILDKYSAKDSRIKTINQKNAGQSAARNAGINLAKGEYIGFLDSDDWADSTLLEKLYLNAKYNDSDLTMCSIAVYDEKADKTSFNDPYMTLDLFPQKLKETTFNHIVCKNFLFRICVTPWNKIYKREWLEKNTLKFAEGLNFEDTIFAVETLLSAKKISLVDEPLVFYRKQSQTSYSVGQREKDYKKMDFFKVFEEIENILVKKGCYQELKDYFTFYKKNTLIYWYNKIHDAKTKKTYYKKLVKIYPGYRLNFLTSYIKNIIIKNKINKIAKKNKVVIWGANNIALSVLNNNNKNIVGIVDINPELHGKIFKGYKTYSIEDLKSLNPDVILGITQNYYKFSDLIKIKLEDFGLNFKIIELLI